MLQEQFQEGGLDCWTGVHALFKGRQLTFWLAHWKWRMTFIIFLQCKIRSGSQWSQALTPFYCLVLRAGWLAGHKLDQSSDDFRGWCASVSQDRGGNKLHEEGVTFPPEFVVACNSFPVGRNKIKIYHQNPTKQRNNFSFLLLWMRPGDQVHLDCGEEIYFLNREGN